MKAGQVLDLRTDLMHRLTNDDPFRRQVAFMVSGAMGDTLGGPDAFEHRDEINRAVDARMPVVDTFANYMKVAEVYRVSEDMSAMVQYAASQLDDTDAIDLSLAPTQCGFVRFDKPLPMGDVHGKTMFVHWLVWGPFEARDMHGKVLEDQRLTAVLTFSDPRTEPDEVHEEMLALARKDRGAKGVTFYSELVGRFATTGFDYLFDGSRLGPPMMEPSEKQRAESALWGREALPGTNPTRYIHALWLLLNQSVTHVAEEQVNRSAEKRAEKRRLPSRVTVVRLRREASSMERKHGESHVEWQHRWIVRGHWRWQACGEGRSERRRIWINPFVKGPDGAPFVQSEKVYSLER